MENGFIKHYNENPSQSIGKYLTANSRKEPSNEFLGEPYSIYYTNFGEKILLMGWIYNFTLNSINTDVVDVSDALNQQWFIDAMNIEDIDMIIFTMHIDPTTPPEMDEIYSTVRMYHPNTPFILFTGHRHILYYEELDSNSFTLESGKYFEVIGIVEFDLENGNFNNFEYYWMDTSVEVSFYLIYILQNRIHKIYTFNFLFFYFYFFRIFIIYQEKTQIIFSQKKVNKLKK